MSVGDGQAVGASTAEAGPAARELTIVAAWNLLNQARASFTSLETRAAIIAPSVVGGLIAVWTQLDTFDSGLTRSLVWASWGVLVGALALLATLIAPQRALHSSIAPAYDDELVYVTGMLRSLQSHTRRLHVALELSVGLSMLGLALIVVAYVVEKT